jgi:uncharacterized protein
MTAQTVASAATMVGAAPVGSLAPAPAKPPVQGAGLGLRRAFLGAAAEHAPTGVAFWELAPENWIGVGGAQARTLRAMTERHPFIAHGLSLSIGSPAPLDLQFVARVGRFLDSHGISDYSEHLSFSSDDGQLYDLLPIPFTEEAVRHVASRVRQVQDCLGRRIALENVSYYAAPGQEPGREMAEIDFVCAVLAQSDCDLLLDVNNVYVNSVNHGYDARAFIASLPAERVRYGHIAGHDVAAPDLLVDTHGSAVLAPVWDLLDYAYARCGVFPTLLERDFNIPALAQMLGEVGRIAAAQDRACAARAGRCAHG